MKETTVLNRINSIVDNIKYKKLYVEIETTDNKYILEKDNRRQIGFNTEAIK